MREDKTAVTLIGVGQAKVGSVFIHRGPGSKCEECRYSRICVESLEPERAYRIIRVREKTLHCDMYEAEMQVVEVVEAEVPATAPSKQAISGAIITFYTPGCNEYSCENFELCFPTGLRDGDRCTVVEVKDRIRCPQGLALRRVLLRRVPAS
jgi:hypothetical protein